MASAYPGPPSPASIDGTDWNGLSTTAGRNALDLDLRNLRQAAVDGRGARLNVKQSLTLKITSDGPATVRLDLALPQKVKLSHVSGAPGKATRTRREAKFVVTAGTATFEVKRR